MGLAWGTGCSRREAGTPGWMVGVRRGARAEFGAPSPAPRGVTGQVLPCSKHKGDQPAPKICPLRPHPCSQPSRHEVGDRPGGPAPPGGPRGGIRDIACEGAPARPGRAVLVTRSHATGGWGGKWFLKDQGGGLPSRSLARGQGGAGAAQDQLPPRLAAGWGAWGESPTLGTIVGVNRGALCPRRLHHLQGNSTAPVICVLSRGHGHPSPFQPRGEGDGGVPPEMSPLSTRRHRAVRGCWPQVSQMCPKAGGHSSGRP